MANIAYCTVTIDCSDPKKLLHALIEKGYVQGEFNSLDESEFEGYIELDQLTTGYQTDSRILFELFDGLLVLEGGARAEAWFSREDLKMIKDVCTENDIELESITSKWYDEFFERFGAQVWPLPQWILAQYPSAYADGFAYAHPDEDYDDSVAFDEDDVNDPDFDKLEFANEFIQCLLEALQTGNDPGFNQPGTSLPWKKWLPHCIVYDYSVDEDNLVCDDTFEWDWA